MIYSFFLTHFKEYRYEPVQVFVGVDSEVTFIVTTETVAGGVFAIEKSLEAWVEFTELV